ncbi:hypothetical protein QUF75_03775 [Desulfococcaceae bacterium HSG7]|nr:hypothetical protein [Desulfococcaceae bacterium HSG7]
MGQIYVSGTDRFDLTAYRIIMLYAYRRQNTGVTKKPVRPYVRGLVTLSGECLKKYWKIGLHRIRVLHNFLLKTFDHNIAIELSRYD